MRLDLTRIGVFALLVAAGFCGAARARPPGGMGRWAPDGVIAAPVRGQFEAHLLLGRGRCRPCRDRGGESGAGSVLVYWSDGRWHDSSDIYGQLLTPDGFVSRGWPDTGLMIVRAPDSQRAGIGLSHPDGSFIVSEADFRPYALGIGEVKCYLSHVLPEGNIDPTWPRQGLLAFDRVGDQSAYRMVSTAPDTFVVLSVYSYPDYVIPRWLFQRVALTREGPQKLWGAGGMLYQQWRPHPPGNTVGELLPDGAGGVYVLFSEIFISGPGVEGDVVRDDIYLMRLGRDGLPAPGWSASRRVVFAPGGWDGNGVFCSDGAGGMYVAWTDAHVELVQESYNPDRVPYFEDMGARLERLTSEGAPFPGWPADGMLVGPQGLEARYGAGVGPSVLPDGAGGVYVSFYGGSSVTHVRADGTFAPGWTQNGIQLPGGHSRMVLDGSGGVFVAFEESGNDYIRLQHVLASGMVDPHWPPFGGRVGIGDLGEYGSGDIVSDGVGGCYVSALTQLVPFDPAPVVLVNRFNESGEVPSRRAEVTAEVELKVPEAAVFWLAGASPNPALARELSVAFSLTGSGAAKLEVFDLAGRREYTRELSGMAPGQHALPLGEARLAPGIHWLHLEEGAREAITRAVVVR